MRTLARLVLFGSLACGPVVSQQPLRQVGPPNIEIISRSWLIRFMRPSPSAPRPNSQTVERGDKGMEPIDPTPKITETPREIRVYVYSAVILNPGPRDIKALSWDYLFSDPVTRAELKRQSGFSAGKVRVNQKKTLQIRTPSSPPKVINAGSINAKGSPFDERVSIQCILFEDGSFWENPDARGTACDKLSNWRLHK